MMEINTLFYSSSGIEEHIYSVARQVLATDNLLVHPDYIEVRLQKDKKSIGVDEVYPVVKMGLQRPVLAEEKGVAIIWGMDLLTPAAQNKLLLTLEANKNVLILATMQREDLVLDTVKSRMRVVNLQKSTYDMFRIFGTDSDILWLASHHDFSLAQTTKDFAETYRQIEKICLEKDDMTELLPIMHLVKEKDKDHFGQNRPLMECCFTVMADTFSCRAINGFMNRELASKYSRLSLDCSIETKRVWKTSYSKEDFFLKIINIIEMANA